MICSEWEKKGIRSELSNGNDGGEEEDKSKWNGMTQRSDSSVRASDKMIFVRKFSVDFFGDFIGENPSHFIFIVSGRLEHTPKSTEDG